MFANYNSVLLIILIVAILSVGYLIYDNFLVEQPEDVVYKFLQALNELDFNTAIACYDPKYEKLYGVTNKVLDKVVGINLSDLSDTLPFMIEIAEYESGNNYEERYFEITEIISKEVNGDKATIYANFKITDKNGNLIDSGDDYVYLQKFNVGWRIVEM